MRVTPQCDTIASFPICNRANAQFSPSVIYNGENYLVTWTDRRFTGTHFWATAARVTPEGVVVDTGYCIGSQNAHDEFYPNTAFDGTRCFTVWFHSYYPPYGIHGRFVNSNAQPEDSVIMISSTQAYLNNFPKVEFGMDEYLVVWADKRLNGTDYDIYGQIVSPQGQLVGDTIMIAGGPENQQRPDVVYDGRSYLVVWCEGDYVYGQRVSTAGLPIGSAFRISNYTAIARYTPRCCAGINNFCVIWSEQQGSYTDIYGNVDVTTCLFEQKSSINPSFDIPTIINSQDLSRLMHRKNTIYDISGRRLSWEKISTGVYFVQGEGSDREKIIVLE